MIPKDFNPNPPPPNPILTINPAELVALATLVKAIVALTAFRIERSEPGGGQAWINNLSALSQDVILNGNIDLGGAYDVEAFRREAMEHVNNLLKAVGPINVGGSRPEN
jgi:hypothetical protein